MTSEATYTRTEFNNAWDQLQSEWESIRENSVVDANNIEYHAQQLINAWVAGLINQGVQSCYRSCYYQVDSMINNLPVTFRVSNHRGYSDQGYKNIQTGIAMLDAAIKAEPPRYVVSIEVVKDRDIRNSMSISIDDELNIARISLVNITNESELDAAICYLESEISDLF